MSKCDGEIEFIYNDIPTTSDRISPEYWILENKKNFTNFIDNTLTNIIGSDKNKIKDDFHKQQKFVAQYLSDKSPYKSLLLYHGLGSGKTAASILISEGAPSRECIIMLPASLKSNYLGELNKFASFKNISKEKCPLEDEFKNQICEEILKKSNWCFHEFSTSDIKKVKDEAKKYLSQYGIKKVGINENLTISKEGEYKIIFNHKTNQFNSYCFAHTKEPGEGNITLVNNSDLNIKAKHLEEKLNNWFKKQLNDGYKNWILINVNDKKDYEENYTILDQVAKKRMKYFKQVYGIWMISKDKEKPANYNKLKKEDKIEILKTLEVLFNKKFRFIHYNSKSHVSKYILGLLDFKQIQSFYKKIGFEVNKTNIENQLKTPLNKRQTNIFIESIKNGEIKNPFSNKLIVIDEIHNLINSISGGGYSTQIFYELLMISYNTKIIGLSGTPSINHPYELALLFNLLTGYQNLYKINFPNDVSTESIKGTLLKSNIIDYYEIRRNPQNMPDKQTEINITLNPCYFINKYEDEQNNKYIGVSYSQENTHNLSEKDDIQLLESLFKEYDNKFINNPEKYALFKNDKEEFIEKYVDEGNNIIKAKYNFIRRIIGRVSFFNEITSTEEDGGSVFPNLIKNKEPNKEELSNYQFKIYTNARKLEILDEENQRKRSNKKGEQPVKDGGYYKVRSRNSLLFSFPPDIKRIWPLDIKIELDNIKEVSEVSLEDIDEGVILDNEEELEDLEELTDLQKEIKVRYDKAKAEMLEKLTLNDNYLTFNREPAFPFDLSVLSPKYISILKNILYSPGLSLCYSQFRSMEGLTIFEKVLEKHGFAEYNDTINSDTLQNSYMVRLEIQENFYITCRLAKLNHSHYYFCKEEIDDNIKKVAFDNGNENITEINKIIQQFNDKCEKITDTEDIDKNIFSYINYVNKNFIRIDKKELNNKIFQAKYVNWQGDAEILEKFNNQNNRFGKDICIIMISMSGAEGISLFNIRQVHIMEPFWNIVKINQVIGRARRISSHKYLPINQRNVRVYEYVSVFSRIQLNGNWTKGEIASEPSSSASESSSSASEPSSSASESSSSASEPSSSASEPVSSTIEKIIIPNKDGRVSYGTDEEIKQIINNYKSYTNIISNDRAITSDEDLRNMAINKSTLMSSFLNTIQEAAIDCEYNKSQNSQSMGKEISCFNTDNQDLPIIYETPTKDKKFIYVPGKDNFTTVVSRKVFSPKKKTIEQSNKTILRFKVDDKFIGCFLDIIPKISSKIPMLDIYKFYGLDPTLPGGTFKAEIIGEVLFNEFNQPIFNINETFINDTEKIGKYIILEKTRFNISKINKKYQEIPKKSKDLLEWISMNRSENIKILEKVEESKEVEESKIEEEFREDEVKEIDNSKVQELFGKNLEEIKLEKIPKKFILAKLKEIKKNNQKNFIDAQELGKKIIAMIKK